VLSIWGSRSLTHSGLLPVDRLVGWLVEHGRREDAAAVVTYARELGRPVDRVDTPDGRRLDVPVIDVSTVAPEALALRNTER
jgi:CDP-glycerol glycerophosphotransferase